MLVLENIEKINEMDPDLFLNDFIGVLLESCQDLSIMISSCEWVEAYKTGQKLVRIEVHELDRVQSVKMFMEFAGKDDFSASELSEFFNEHFCF